jgi:xylan 1,4-beta-xylosidase
LKLVVSQSLTPQTDGEVELKISATGNTYSFFYATSHHEWKLLVNNIDAKFLSTKEAGGFVGSIFALYATSTGISSSNKAWFNWLEYKGDDIVFKK